MRRRKPIYVKPKSRVRIINTDEAIRLFNKVAKQEDERYGDAQKEMNALIKGVIGEILQQENAIFEKACRENADPPLSEISKEILELNGITMHRYKDHEGSRKWLEQRGRIISPVIVQRF